MTFLTIFTTPKPFTDPHIAMIQRNAIRSWLSLGEEVEVLLVGDETGVAEAASELSIPHLPDVERNEWGTPLISSIFSLARAASNSPLLAYINADILIMPDFVRAAHHVAAQTDQFLIVGQRWDLDLRHEMDFSTGWVKDLRQEIKNHGRLHAPAGSDYFIFPRDCYKNMPEFAVGRAGWDNWMIFHARKSGWVTIDATPSIMIVHQDHDYSHLPGGQPHYRLEESDINRDLAGGEAHLYILMDINKRLIDAKIRPINPSLERILRRIELLLLARKKTPGGLRWLLAMQFRKARLNFKKRKGS